MSSAKKYKLFSAAGGDPAKRPCAFFVSPAGCRNGDNCKFSHSTVVPESSEEAINIKASNSVVSSEESDSNESEDERQFAKVPAAVVKSAEPKQEKKKRKRSAEDSDPFAKPKSTPGDKKKKTPTTPSPAPVPVPVQSSPAPAAAKTKKKKTLKATKTPDFRTLNLPIAAFSIPGVSDPVPEKVPEEPEVVVPEAVAPAPAPVQAKPKPNYPVPCNTEVGRRWMKVVKATQAHPEFDSIFSLQKYKDRDLPGEAWVQTKPFGDWCKDFPQAIAIDCEMCETRDPVSGEKNHNALCRVSIVNAENPDEVLLDTLVKPSWPVTDYRTWVNGIKKEDLEGVQFTLRHAQAFMLALCSDETVILGHAIHNDLAAMRVEHSCGGDSALLFKAKDSPTATVSLKDLAMMCMGKEMPSTHDSVNDARVAMLCLDYWRERDGEVEEVVRTPSNKNRGGGYAGKKATHHKLFVHRIPKVCKTIHLSKMFIEHTAIAPEEVDEIDFSSGHAGKTYASFKSPKHANLAFDSLAGDGEKDKSGRLQKKVYLRDGDYVRIRKMAFESDHKFPDGRGRGSPKKTEE